MVIDFSHIMSWFWVAIALVIVFVILRYFFHIVVHIFHFIISFFWHGCVTLIVIIVIYYILRALHVI